MGNCRVLNANKRYYYCYLMCKEISFTDNYNDKLSFQANKSSFHVSHIKCALNKSLL